LTELARSRIETVRHRSGWPPITAAWCIGVLAESRHSGALAPAPDRLRDRGVVEPRLTQIGAGGCLVALPFAVRKGAMALRDACSVPDVEAGLHLCFVLGKSRGTKCHDDAG